LCDDEGYTWLSNRHVIEARPHGVRDHTGAWHEGDLIVCCIGASPGGFLADLLSGAPIRRVRLQMLETKPHAGALSTALADGDSLRYYPAYAGKELDALAPQDEGAAKWGAQLLVVKRQSGHLTIGDTHIFEEPFAFDVDDGPYEHLLRVASEILGPIPAVERRWSGVYIQVTDNSLMYLKKEVEPGVFVITGAGGRGMTMAPAIAEETFL
jgi:glycine/D-amino acid oxidase-like deaminating enzyme